MKNTVVKIGVAIAVLAVVGILAAGAVVFVLGRLQRTSMASSQSNVDPQKKAALDGVYQAGLMSQDEYNAKLKALSAGVASARPVSGQPPNRNKVSWRVETVYDPLYGAPAYKVKIPADWKFEGQVVRSACEADYLVWRAESPDGLTGIQRMPRVHWVYSENPQVLRKRARITSQRPKWRELSV